MAGLYHNLLNATTDGKRHPIAVVRAARLPSFPNSAWERIFEKLCFSEMPPDAKLSFASVRSQAELGTENCPLPFVLRFGYTHHHVAPIHRHTNSARSGQARRRDRRQSTPGPAPRGDSPLDRLAPRSGDRAARRCQRRGPGGLTRSESPAARLLEEP